MSTKDKLFVGMDVGSTTAKAVVMNDAHDILWKRYARHNAHQQELALEYLTEIEQRYPGKELWVFTTGSGGRSVGQIVGAKHIQEVNAVTVAVERLHPNAGSAVELGGQDAKVILWKTGPQGRKTQIAYMNDKCAGGTGATLDKIFSKLHLSEQDIRDIGASDVTIHHIAAKCGVFAETDVVGLLKSGVDEAEIVVSLCSAIVKQNIEVLLHGNPLTDEVVLLGGPHTYFRAFVDIWRREIPHLWKLHKWVPRDTSLEALIYVPENARFYAALGAVWFGQAAYEAPSSPYRGVAIIRSEITTADGRERRHLGTVRPGLVSATQEVSDFAKAYEIPPFSPPPLSKGTSVDCFVGIDGGSTSSKLAIIDDTGNLLYKDYVLSKGNPIVDVAAMFDRLINWQAQSGITFRPLATGVTGYASDILQTAFSLDTAIVETIAHLKSATHYYGALDIICDVGGQDIKILFMKHGRVVDIKLNTQCSAGNGYFLQSMAHQFNIDIEHYAEHAFSVRHAPAFNYGCAVFMEQDKVNFQQMGWTRDEIMAGLALVLPQNIWNYVVQETNLKRLGTRFLLQGGTQKNLAAVKAQVDFITERVPDAQVFVHRYADVAGAIGAAIEAQTRAPGNPTAFSGFAAAAGVTFKSRNDKQTRCTFCSNRCTRSFIDITTPGGDMKRHISGYACEKGAFEELQDMKEGERQRCQQREKCPNLVARAEASVFETYAVAPVPDGLGNADSRQMRKDIVVGIPRLLNLFYYAPFFNAYFRSLGVKDVVYSDPTSRKLWDAGNKWGSIDPCFPAKVAPAHVYNLLKNEAVTHICFPMITHLESMVENSLGNNACVIQMGTSEVVDAAFTRGRNHFKDANTPFWKPLVRMDRPSEAQGNLFDYFQRPLGITRRENDFAARQGYAAMERYLERLRQDGADVINDLVANDRMGILLIGHPYHHDSGLNHGIPEAFQSCDFPVLCIESLPTSDAFLQPLFRDAYQRGRSPFDINDVWFRNFNRNTNVKIWAAMVAARHPNLAVVDLSSFKCGHDAPTYSYVDRILDASETPHFLFHDLDQNRPSSSIRIRVQSIKYFLEEEQQRLRHRVKSDTLTV